MTNEKQRGKMNSIEIKLWRRRKCKTTRLEMGVQKRTGHRTNCHITRMEQQRLVRQIYEAKGIGRRILLILHF